MTLNFYKSNFKTLAFIFSALLLLASGAFAQNTKTVSGIIIDAGTKKPVEFATVAIQDKAGKVLDGTTCDIQGNFSIPSKNPGEYNLAISFIGYQTKIQPITIPASGRLPLGKIELPLDSKALNEVVVTAEKPNIEQTDDGFVYNAEKDINAAGGTASDVLKNVPGISLDPEGNIEMQGTTKIKVLIDNKPSSILAGNLAEALRQIPANMIAKVEVITTPSAKYDSEGTGGIINIITKKNTTLSGYSGGVNVTGGNRANNVNTNVNTKIGKASLNGSLGANVNRNFGNGENEQVYYEKSQVMQSNDYQNDGQGFNGQVGANVDINEKNNINATLRTSNYASVNDRIGIALETSSVPVTMGQILRNDRSNTDSKNSSNSFDGNLDYTKKFKNKDQELSLLMLYTKNSNQGDNYSTRTNKDEVIDNRQQSNNHASNDEFTVQADYEHPFNKYGTMEAGAKITFRDNQSNSDYAWAKSMDAELIIDPKRTNIFSYDQNVYSGYLNYGFRIKKKLGFRFGGRYEYTDIYADFVTTNTTLHKPYKSFMPNITTTYRLPKNARVSLNYSTRIFRPQIEFLNPYADSTNRRSIRMGNPNLLPELTHNMQFSYSNYIKFTGINASLYWRQTDDNISQFRTFSRIVDPTALKDTNPYNDSINSVTSTWLNNGNNITYGTNLSLNTRLKKLVQVGTNLSLYYNEINGFIYSDLQRKTIPVSNNALMYSINFNAGFRIPKSFNGPFKDFGAQLSTSINSPRVNLQGKSSSIQRYSFSLRKEFMVKKGSQDRASINFSIENFLNSGNQIRTTVYNEKFTQTNIQNFYNRIYRVGLSYNFSRMEYKAKPEQPRRSINNDDKQKMDIGEVKEIKDQKLPENNQKGNQNKGNGTNQKKPVDQTNTKKQ